VLARDENSENIFISPTSISLALAMTYNGAAGDTKSAMETALKTQGFTAGEINGSYKSLVDALLSVDPKVLLEIANSIWYRQDFSVLPGFIDTNQTYYSAEVSPLDFDLPGAPGVINNWVNDQTHGKIREIVRDIPPEAMMYLINAIYFKGIWKYEFKEENTVDDNFYLEDGTTVTIPMMKQTTDLRYASQDWFSMAELPYGQGNFSMLILLPGHGHTTGEITAALTPENWDEWMGSLADVKMELHLPRFRFAYENTLNDELESMGMGIAFTDQADFSGINGMGGLLISKVLHKSFVEVNEEGTEAAAVTSVQIDVTSIPGTDPATFYVDRPFIFAIRELSTGTILFIGLVQNPLSEGNE